MKKYVFTFLLAAFLLPAAGLCIAGYNVGDQLYVLAPSGLILRESANAQGKKITTVALGEAVTVLKENFKKVPHSVEEFKGYNIRGFWVKVRTADGKEGYVFDGYLSRYQAPGSLRLKEGQDTLLPAVQYFAAHTDLKGGRINLQKTPNRYERYKQLFKNGAEVEVNSGEGGSTFQMTFNKGTTIEEGYLIGRLLWLEGTVKSRIERGVLTLTNQEETQEVMVKNKAGIVVVTLSIAD